MRKITERMLRRAGACTDQLNLFIELFPNGVVPTREVCASVADKFDWRWAARNLLSSAEQRAYDEARVVAWRAYDVATTAARRAVCEARAAAVAAADRTYDEACVAAQLAYDEVCVAAWCAYDEGRAAAFADAWASV